MADGINKAILFGIVGTDPKVQEFETGKIATFRVNTPTSFKSGGRWKRRAQWHSVVIRAAGLIDRIIPKVTKGAWVFVEGEIVERDWKTEDGKKGVRVEIVVPPVGGNFRICSGPAGEAPSTDNES